MNEAGTSQPVSRCRRLDGLTWCFDPLVSSASKLHVWKSSLIGTLGRKRPRIAPFKYLDQAFRRPIDCPPINRRLSAMALVPNSDQVTGDRLAALTAASGPSADIAVKALCITPYEVQGHKAPFTILAVMVVDAQGDMIHVVEHLFGGDGQRKALVAQRCAFWMPDNAPAVFRLKDLRKVVRQKTHQLSCSVAQSVIMEHFGTTKATLKCRPVMKGSMEDKVLPPYYLPRRVPLAQLSSLEDGTFVTVCGMVVSKGMVETTTKGPVRQLDITDGATLLSGVKVWHENGRADLEEVLKVGESIVVLQNYWAGVNAGEQGGVSKLVNVPDRSKLVILQEVNLTSEDQKYLKELQASKPQHTIVLEENEKNSSRVGKRLAQWILQPAEQTSALALSALNKSEEHTDPTLHRLDGALVEVDMTTEWRTKKGGVFAKVLLTDHTGQVACRSGSEALLALMQLPGEDESELVRCLESHHWMPQRGDLYVERQVAADRDDPGVSRVSLILRAAVPKHFGSVPVEVLGLSAGLYPCALHQIAMPCFGSLKVAAKTVQFPLVLLKGGRLAPRTKQDQNGVCSITNLGVQCLADVEHGQDLRVEVVAKVPLEVQTQYVIDGGVAVTAAVAGGKGFAVMREKHL